MSSPAQTDRQHRLPDAVQTRLDANGGVASVRELAEIGADRFAVAALVRRGALLRVRRGAVVDAVVWTAATPTGRHGLRARAVLGSMDPAGTGPYALSHHSALAVQGVPVFRVDRRVHLVRTDGRRGHITATTHVHPPVTTDQVHPVEGLRVVRPAKAALQVAGAAGIEAGLVSADAALHSGVCSGDDLQAALLSGGYGHGVGHARMVAELADGRIESPGESRLRWLLRSLGYHGAVPQGLIRDEDGGVVARVDFLFEAQRVVVEFDGRLKYGGADVVWNEKQREDRIRQLGYEVVRVTWADLQKPMRVRALLIQAFARAAARRAAIG